PLRGWRGKLLSSKYRLLKGCFFPIKRKRTGKEKWSDIIKVQCLNCRKREENGNEKVDLFSAAKVARASTDELPCSSVDGTFWQSQNIASA
ncbi:MAG: hypothetical protein ACTTH7_08470, partial [Treponema sp.]